MVETSKAGEAVEVKSSLKLTNGAKNITTQTSARTPRSWGVWVFGT